MSLYWHKFDIEYPLYIELVPIQTHVLKYWDLYNTDCERILQRYVWFIGICFNFYLLIFNLDFERTLRWLDGGRRYLQRSRQGKLSKTLHELHNPNTFSLTVLRPGWPVLICSFEWTQNHILYAVTLLQQLCSPVSCLNYTTNSYIKNFCFAMWVG